MSVPSIAATWCRDSRSLVEAFVSSMTPSVRAMMYDVTSYVNPKSKGGEDPGAHACTDATERKHEDGRKDGERKD